MTWVYVLCLLIPLIWVIIALELIRREMFTVCILRRHGEHWLRERWVSKRSKWIRHALDTKGMAVMRDGKIEEGEQ